MIFDRQGLTLTELMIALSLVGVMMIGIVSVDRAIRKQYEDVVSGASSTDNAGLILAHVMNNAITAVGSMTPADDRGVWSANDGAANAVSCIRVNYTPTWACYSIASSVLYTCTRNSTGACVSTDPGYAVLGRANNMSTQFAFTSTPPNQSLLYTLTVTIPFGAGTKTASASTALPQHRL